MLRDRDKLEDLAGDSYGAPEAEHRQLIGPLGRTPELLPPVDMQSPPRGERQG